MEKIGQAANASRVSDFLLNMGLTVELLDTEFIYEYKRNLHYERLIPVK